MSGQRPPVFVERAAYRRRRVMDAARMLPLLGVALFILPLLWVRPGDPEEMGGPVPMSTALFYVFGVWAGLIVLSFLFGLKSRGWGPGSPGESED